MMLTSSPGSVPPELPPTVEEAYRRKCIELKQRLIEVEQANDAQRIRTDRARRAVQKMRLERSFLLEQLAKRTSTNVEDSEGSPSPPPTPKEKPLRTKRGHRKPDFLLAELPGSTFIQQGPGTISPSSDAFSHNHPELFRNMTPQSQTAPKRPFPSNGTYIAAAPSSIPAVAQSRHPRNAFDLFCNETRPLIVGEIRSETLESTSDVEAALLREWSNLDPDKKEIFHHRYDEIKRASEGDKEIEIGVESARKTVPEGEPRIPDETGEDTVMADTSTPAITESAGGFTAVNRA
ncbi:HMG box protein [Diplocarpon rosae]|nr:HMG box protein [Diplocarpon rosae]